MVNGPLSTHEDTGMKTPSAAPAHLLPQGLDVQLLYRPIGWISAVAHWISEEGMHVNTGRVVLDHLSEVEINFPHRSNEQTAYHRIIAHVWHRDEDKTVLRFVRCSRAAHEALRELLADAAQ